MFLRFSMGVVLMLGSVAAWGQSIAANLSNHSARFFYNTEMVAQNAGRLDLELSYLYTDNNDYALGAGLLVRNDNLDSPLVISVGGRAYYADITDPGLGNYRAMALTVGGELMVIPDNWRGLGMGLYYFTAPGVVSFLDAKALTEYGGRIDFQVTPQARIYGGYQFIGITTGANNVGVTVDSGYHFGVAIRF